jgi:hypothetical protein
MRSIFQMKYGYMHVSPLSRPAGSLPPRRSENALLNRPACDDLASLVIMCLYSEVYFEPHELANSSGSLDTVPGLLASCKTAIKSVAMLLEFARSRCKPANNVPGSANQLTKY